MSKEDKSNLFRDLKNICDNTTVNESNQYLIKGSVRGDSYNNGWLNDEKKSDTLKELCCLYLRLGGRVAAYCHYETFDDDAPWIKVVEMVYKQVTDKRFDVNKLSNKEKANLMDDLYIISLKTKVLKMPTGEDSYYISWDEGYNKDENDKRKSDKLKYLCDLYSKLKEEVEVPRYYKEVGNAKNQDWQNFILAVNKQVDSDNFDVNKLSTLEIIALKNDLQTIYESTEIGRDGSYNIMRERYYIDSRFYRDMFSENFDNPKASMILKNLCDMYSELAGVSKLGDAPRYFQKGDDWEEIVQNVYNQVTAASFDIDAIPEADRELLIEDLKLVYDNTQINEGNQYFIYDENESKFRLEWTPSYGNNDEEVNQLKTLCDLYSDLTGEPKKKT